MKLKRVFLFLLATMGTSVAALANGEVGSLPQSIIADIANASLAGGVAIGSTCADASYTAAAIIGILAGGLSTFGFAVIQSRQQKWMKIIDTCGVTNLHGLPGLMGGLAALPLIHGINMSGHLSGIGVTIVVAILGGIITGKVLPLMDRREEAYDDAEEFMDAEA